MSTFRYLRAVNRAVVIPTVGFTAGVATFIKGWPDESDALMLADPVQTGSVGSLSKQHPSLQRSDILDKISHMPLYKSLMADPEVHHSSQSANIPSSHRAYHVGQGQLFGPGKLEIDPLIFLNKEAGEITVFYHLGKDLSNAEGKIHKGILSLLLDEGLCFCGFPKLPSKRGVTALLSLNFEKDIPADSTVILRAKVSESKGRKCIIDGTLEAVPYRNPLGRLVGMGTPNHGEVYVRSKCILVEPKWFKYFSFLTAFNE